MVTEVEYIDEGMWMIWLGTSRERSIAEVHEFNNGHDILIKMSKGFQTIPTKALTELIGRING